MLICKLLFYYLFEFCVLSNDLSRERFHLTIYPEVNQVTAKIILDGDNYTERSNSIADHDSSF